MKKFKIDSVDGPTMIFTSRGKNPCRVAISDIRFADQGPTVNMQVDWITMGRYTKGQSKKMLARTITSILRNIVAVEKRNNKHTKG